jgi:hypothetical protein
MGFEIMNLLLKIQKYFSQSALIVHRLKVLAIFFFFLLLKPNRQSL